MLSYLNRKPHRAPDAELNKFSTWISAEFKRRSSLAAGRVNSRSPRSQGFIHSPSIASIFRHGLYLMLSHPCNRQAIEPPSYKTRRREQRDSGFHGDYKGATLYPNIIYNLRSIKAAATEIREIISPAATTFATSLSGTPLTRSVVNRPFRFHSIIVFLVRSSIARVYVGPPLNSHNLW